MARVIEKQDIEKIIPSLDTVSLMEEAFVKYSSGKAVIPPVAELLFDHPPVDVHIKYGYIREDDFYCIKIASGFYQNPKLGLPSSQGMMLLFSQKTGRPEAILLDDGYLTDIRTAAAGALVAKYFAPKNIKAIGIVGTGSQARLQLQYLQAHTPCTSVWVWGRNTEAVRAFKEELEPGFDIHIAKNTAELAEHSNLIVTTTPSQNPLLFAGDIRPGTHITAVGSDTADKQELDSDILKNAHLIISDSLPQSKSRGEIYQAAKEGLIATERVVELGTAIENPSQQRTNDHQLTIADLTGVAVQDIAISEATYTYYLKTMREK